MNVLYYDCFSGISGDMHLGALLDLGVDAGKLTTELAKLGLDGYELRIGRASRQSIVGTRVEVLTETHRHHPHRGLVEIEALIGNSSLGEAVKARAIAVFRRLGEAEARIHGVPIEQIHFHEVGAVDAIVDIVGGAIALESLGIGRILCSPVELGGGTAQCEHGLLPVPAPATLELLKGVPVKLGGVPFEATTPTGAALLATFVDEFVACPAFCIDRIGYGVGQRDSRLPNVLRVCLGEQAEETSGREELAVLECNIDDMNPEFFDLALDRLFEAGALDVWLAPVLMKKSRPGTLLSVLCLPTRAAALTGVLLSETTTLGVRQQAVTRSALARQTVPVTTRYGEVTVKTAFLKGQPVRSKPEYEDCRRLACQHGVPIHNIYAAVHDALAKRP